MQRLLLLVLVGCSAFSLPIRTGQFAAAVLTSYEASELSDTAFLESLVPSAITFSLAEGERKVQNVTLAGG